MIPLTRPLDALELAKLDLPGGLIVPVVGVRGAIGFPNFCIDAAVGVGRDGTRSSIVSSVEVGSVSGAISAGTKGMSFLQFSRKELGASAICVCNAFAVKGTSSSACNGEAGSPFVTWLLSEVDGDGSSIG